MRLILILFISIYLASCTMWPKSATGGYGQHYIFSPHYKRTLNKKDRFYDLYLRIEHLNDHLIKLSKTSLYHCYPAFFRKFHLMLNKSAQQFAAGFYQSSLGTAKRLENAINYIERPRQGRCAPIGKSYQQLFWINY